MLRSAVFSDSNNICLGTGLFLPLIVNISSYSEVLSVEDTYTLFGVGRSTFDGWVAEGELPYISGLGARKYFDPKEILDFLRENKVVYPKRSRRVLAGVRSKVLLTPVSGGTDDWPLMRRSEFLRAGFFAPGFARRVIDQNLIPYIKIGKTVYVDLEVLSQYIRLCCTCVPPTRESLGL